MPSSAVPVGIIGHQETVGGHVGPPPQGVDGFERGVSCSGGSRKTSLFCKKIIYVWTTKNLFSLSAFIIHKYV